MGALTPPVLTPAPPSSNSRESMSTTTRPQEASTSLAPSSSIWSLVPWTLSVLDPTVNSSVPTTLSLVNPALETTGPRDITQRELSSSTPFWTSFAKSQG